MKKIRIFFVYLIFGNKNVQVFKHIKKAFRDHIYSPDVKIDTISIFFFLGKWLPFSIAIGITMGIIASIMDLAVVNINHFLSANIIYLFVYPLLVAIITGQVIKQSPEAGGPGIGYSILHLKTTKYISMKTLV